MVLREFDQGDDAAVGEAHVLTALDGLGGLAPRLLAVNADGRSAERPWLLISRMPGSADIRPNDPSHWAAELGRALARIHATETAPLAGFQSVFDRPGGSLSGLGGPAMPVVGAQWERLCGASNVLTHCDFWSGNVIWEQGVLSGVVDWTGGALGPPGFDVGWCRLDLYLLYDEDVADAFLSTYESEMGAALSHVALWDLWAVARSHEAVETWAANYSPLGRADLDGSELRRRHAMWTKHLLKDA
jgi:aminoglycoside phosphotransferase (APT) family kinase protein